MGLTRSVYIVSFNSLQQEGAPDQYQAKRCDLLSSQDLLFIRKTGNNNRPYKKIVQCFLFFLIRQKSIFPLCIFFCLVAKFFILSHGSSRIPCCLQFNQSIKWSRIKVFLVQPGHVHFPFSSLSLNFSELHANVITRRTAKKFSLSKKLIFLNLKDLGTV